jgi:hypothetical protein
MDFNFFRRGTIDVFQPLIEQEVDQHKKMTLKKLRDHYIDVANRAELDWLLDCYNAGDKASVLFVLAHCLSWGIAIPDCIVADIIRAAEKQGSLKIDSLDEAFGHIPRRQAIKNAGRLYDEAEAYECGERLKRENPKLKTSGNRMPDSSLFTEIGNILGCSPDKARHLYTDGKKNYQRARSFSKKQNFELLDAVIRVLAADNEKYQKK